MPGQVDRYGNPLLPDGLQQIVGSDNVPLRQRPFLKLVSGATAVDNDASNSTDLTFSGQPAPGAAAVAFALSLGATIPTTGTNVPDANTTIALDGGAQYFMPTRTAARVVTLGVAGAPASGEVITLHVTGNGAFAVTVQDDAATLLFTVPASVRMSVMAAWNGTHYANARATRIQ